MIREDILGGLKNALERGATLEQAIRSFINAGYNESEVRQTASQLTSGTLSITQPAPQLKQQPIIQPQNNPTRTILPAYNVQNTRPQTNLPQRQMLPRPIYSNIPSQPYQVNNMKKSSGLGFVTVLVILLILLLGVLIGTIFFKEEILAALNNIL